MTQKFEFLFIFEDRPDADENRDAAHGYVLVKYKKEYFLIRNSPHEDFVRETKEFWRAGGNTNVLSGRRNANAF
jgi:hypothetical protein